MQQNSSYSVNDPSIQSLFIVYSVSQTKSVITGVDDSGKSGGTTNNIKDNNSNAADITKPNTNSATELDRSEDF